MAIDTRLKSEVLTTYRALEKACIFIDFNAKTQSHRDLAFLRDTYEKAHKMKLHTWRLRIVEDKLLVYYINDNVILGVDFFLQ